MSMNCQCSPVKAASPRSICSITRLRRGASWPERGASRTLLATKPASAAAHPCRFAMLSFYWFDVSPRQVSAVKRRSLMRQPSDVCTQRSLYLPNRVISIGPSSWRCSTCSM